MKEYVLYSTDYVVIKPDGDFLKFKDGEIIIYNVLKEAFEDCKKIKGKTACCTILSEEMQGRLLNSIINHNKK